MKINSPDHVQQDERVEGLEGGSYRELRLLEEVDSTPEISQRHLAHRLGIALGVANLLMRNLAKKGHIQANQVGWKQWVYVLTPTGITWKVQLTLAYIDRFMGHYRRVRLLVQRDMRGLDMTPESRIAIYGTTELAELTYLALRDMGVTKIDFFDATNSGYRFLGVPVQALETIDPALYLKVMVAFAADTESRCQELNGFGVSSSQIFTLFQKQLNMTSVVSKQEVSS
ncbi:MAG: winged helix-turn-helix transcriptional regulator [Chloroflexi bacterium]|nr:winged helix-turn-helix transcriptional regulator [Chloroflexota bacterium]